MSTTITIASLGGIPRISSSSKMLLWSSWDALGRAFIASNVLFMYFTVVLSLINYQINVNIRLIINHIIGYYSMKKSCATNSLLNVGVVKYFQKGGPNVKSFMEDIVSLAA